MDAVISDIHGNLEALVAVENKIKELGCERTICLGDVVCYGPDSIECIRRSASYDIVVAGNYDLATLELDSAKRSISENREINKLRAKIYSVSDAADLLRILRSFSGTVWENEKCFAHGSPLNIAEYLFPETIYDKAKLDRVAESFQSCCFVGHSHIAGIFEQDADSEWAYVEPTLGEQYSWNPSRKTIISVGSVGMPKDQDQRACFVTADRYHFEFHRVEYDIDSLVRRIELQDGDQ